MFKTLPLMFGIGGFTYNNYNQQKAKCCGIIGILTVRNNAEVILQEGIELLQNRGYDSAGLATIKKDSSDDIVCTKIASDILTKTDCIEELHKVSPINHSNSYIGIAHTRWATCGAKTNENSHPHYSTDKNIYLVHNGTIDNFKQIRQELEQTQDIVLTSQTDSELIVQLIMIQRNKGLSLFEAVKHVTSQQIQGQWALVVMDKREPETLIVARQGSPLLIGIHDDSIFIASEKIAFEKHTDNYIQMKDGEVMELTLQNRKTFYQNKYEITKIQQKNEIQLVPKEGFNSFFHQEIFDQPETLNKTLNNGARLAGISGCTKLGGLEQHISSIVNIENLLIIACGSSLYAGTYALNFFKQLNCFNTVQMIEGSEFTEKDLPKNKGGMIVISQSGETMDLREAQIKAKENNVFTIGVINTVGSFLANNVECGVYINCGREIGVAASKSFTSQVTALLLIATFISHYKDKQSNSSISKRIQLIENLRQLPLTVGQTLFQIQNKCKEIALVCKDQHSLIILGKGPLSPLAKEGALKIKELTYIHAEGFSAGELKHGPLALIDPVSKNQTVIIVLIISNIYFNEMNLALSEIQSRNALPIIITDVPEQFDQYQHVIPVQNCGILTSLMTILPIQLLTNYICELKGLNADKPRNLAKCVTVK